MNGSKENRGEYKQSVYRTFAAKLAPWTVSSGVIIGLAVLKITDQPPVVMLWATSLGYVICTAMFGVALAGYYNKTEGAR